MSDNIGNIVQVIGPVIDADFSKTGKLPKIYDALEVNYEVYGKPTKLVLEVQQHLGDGWVRAVAMSSSEGLKRGGLLEEPLAFDAQSEIAVSLRSLRRRGAGGAADRVAADAANVLADIRWRRRGGAVLKERARAV